MTGRHRGQPTDGAAEDVVDEGAAGEGASRGRRIAVVAAAFAVPVLVASVIAFGLRDDPVRERPETAATPTRQAAPAPPEGEPTFGRYVPPEADPQVASKAPERAPAPVVKPRKTKPAPAPSPSARGQRPCPAGWEDVWWMRRWCEPQGHRVR
ncbi:hypothetical protein E1293_46435 [Actinomadura darangshiensis]|uniref:Uncharacterized protein n=1 Tax=Actinomadura darangshiensis TaxID=705336 RepID=A0A4R4ZMS7_9ACTN|nr:hypothetical protein E1293_46435 [Actinomadura darangshiensis]